MESWFGIFPHFVLGFIAASLFFTMPLYVEILLKCIPIVILMVHVFLLTETDEFEEQKLKYPFLRLKRKARLIWYGLAFSCIGDALLVVPGTSFLQLGMLSFGVGHVFYITAFGFERLKWEVFVVLATVAAYVIPYLLSNLHSKPDLSDMGTYVWIYGFVLTIMTWRAVAQFTFKRPIDSKRAMVCLGGILFLYSDSQLAYCLLVTGSVSAVQQVLIYVSYYAAQYCISHYPSVNLSGDPYVSSKSISSS